MLSELTQSEIISSFKCGDPNCEHLSDDSDSECDLSEVLGAGGDLKGRLPGLDSSEMKIDLSQSKTSDQENEIEDEVVVLKHESHLQKNSFGL